MKLTKMNFILFFWSVFCGQLFAQGFTEVKLVGSYLEANGTMRQYADAYDELLDLMQTQFPESNSNGNGWLYLQRNKKKAMDEIKDILVAIYIQHFSPDEIKQMHAFYDTETGQQLAKGNTTLNKEQKRVFDKFFQSKLGKKIKRKQTQLSDEISAASEYWSKDLYQTAVLLLNE